MDERCRNDEDGEAAVTDPEFPVPSLFAVCVCREHLAVY